MPNFKRNRKKTKKTTTRRRRYNNQRVSLNVIPKSTVKKFRYVQDISIDPVGAGVMQSYVFRANSLYDPDYESVIVGHQPYGFDQYVPTLYNHATVLGSKITCVFSLGNPALYNAQNNIICGLSLKDSSIKQTNSELVREQGGYSTWTMISNAEAPKTKSLKYSAKKFHGVRDVKDNQQLQCSGNNNPEEQAFFHIWACPPASNVDSSNVLVQVIIEYIALLQEPNTFSQS